MSGLTNRLKHPQIHIDYYAWLDKQKAPNSYLVQKAAELGIPFNEAHNIAMFAWSQSRETLAETCRNGYVGLPNSNKGIQTDSERENSQRDQ